MDTGDSRSVMLADQNAGFLPQATALQIRDWPLPREGLPVRRCGLANGVTLTGSPGSDGLLFTAQPFELGAGPLSHISAEMGLAAWGNFTGERYSIDFEIDPALCDLQSACWLKFVFIRNPAARLRADQPSISRVLLSIRRPSELEAEPSDEIVQILARGITAKDLPYAHEVLLSRVTLEKLRAAFNDNHVPAGSVYLSFDFGDGGGGYLLSKPVIVGPSEALSVVEPLQPVFEDARLTAQASSFPAQAKVRAWPEDDVMTETLKWKSSSSPIDVVVPVHNAWPHVQACLASLDRTLDIPYRLILIDDGSDAEARDGLIDYAQSKPWVSIIRHEVNRGYTASANRGIVEGVSDYVVLLNSDTICTHGWISRLVEIAESDRRIAGVGPLSNAATAQSVPIMRDARRRWAINEVPPGLSIEAFAELVGRLSRRELPQVPLLNGFCTLFRRSALNEVGYFDEAAFPMGYGEENDLCYRLTQQAYSLVVADDVFIYHAKSASFGDQTREALSHQGGVALEKKHPDMNLQAIRAELEYCAPLIALRKRLQLALVPMGIDI